MLKRLLQGAHGLGRGVLDTVLPGRCLVCSAVVDEPGALCAGCFREVGFISAPFCQCCGVPLAHAGLADRQGRCPFCVAEPPPFARARAAFRYDAPTRRVILAFKHADRPEMAAPLARHMWRAGRAMLDTADVIVPVPLHRWRLLRRRYNQAALLARAVGKLAGTRVLVDGLCRLRATPSLGDHTAEERAGIVAGAFAVPRRHVPLIGGRRVVVVDDVMTSGATVSACARALLEAGAAQVDVLVAARVPHPALSG